MGRLARTFPAQIEALNRYRSHGEPAIAVQNVSVGDGGKAIVVGRFADVEVERQARLFDGRPHGFHFGIGIANVTRIVGQHHGLEAERLEVADDLVHVLHHPIDGLVLVHHPVDAEAPDGGAAERGEQQPPHGVAKCMTEPALQRLDAELGDVRRVLAANRLDELRRDETAKIDSLWHRA